MKVKCIKTLTDKKGVTNGDMREYLVEGSIFWVYGITFVQGITYCYIFNDEHLFEVPFELFEVIEDKVSPLWIVRAQSNGDVTICPKLFYGERFIENFAEREDTERNEFISLREQIENENGD